MRITLLASNDLPSNYALNLLVKDLSVHDLTLFLSDRVGKPTSHPQALKDLERFEQTLTASHSFEPRRSCEGRHRQTNNALISFDELALKTGGIIRTLNSINAPDELDVFRRSQPDLVISVRYGVILKDEVISVPPFGVLNLHSGLLPDYKGVMATFRAMLNGEEVIGTTLHYIRDSSIDTGPVIGTTRLPVDRRRSYLWHVLNLYTDGCKLVVDTVNLISTGLSVDTTDQSRAGKYYSFPTGEDLEVFRKTGLKLFDGEEINEFAELFIIPVEENS